MRRSRSGRSWATLTLLVLGFSGLLFALSLVTWRQSRAFEALAELDRLERSLSLAESERTDLLRRIQGLDSRTRISSVAQERLGMHHPDASEIVLLSGRAQ
jgi:cell division protein FtsL